MDVSPVQSKSASSDFSIERILSDDRPQEAPSWLLCTRYQPPRIPRGGVGGGGGARGRRAGRHARVPFTAAQAAALEAAFARAPYLAPPAARALAAALQLRDDRIKIWFQNRRARERREKSTVISPPHSVPLPPTPWSQPRASPSQRLYYPPTQPQDLTYDPSSAHNTTNSSSEGSDEERPETPLDVETVDDNV